MKAFSQSFTLKIRLVQTDSPALALLWCVLRAVILRYLAAGTFHRPDRQDIFIKTLGWLCPAARNADVSLSGASG